MYRFTAEWGSYSNPGLAGPAGFPRENCSLIGTGLTGHPALGALDFLPENRPGLQCSLGV
jgi:hypothetical protein